MSGEASVMYSLTVPLVAAYLIWLTGDRPNLRETVTIVAAVILFVLVAALYPDVMAGDRPEIVVAEMLPGLRIAFVAEPLGLLFAAIASFLWIVTSVYSIGYMRGHHEQNQTRFYLFFALSLSATMGIAFAGNLLTLFLFYEALTLATFPLVTHAGTDEARRAGRVYLGILLGTSIVFLMMAVVWTWTLTGTLDFVEGGILEDAVPPGTAEVLLLLYVFGTGKAALMPFHRWLPAAMVAPTPVSALLHAVAVVKAGVFTVLKISVYTFGPGFLYGLATTAWLQWTAAATLVIASLVALTRDNLKARLAYSTVSQLSYIVLAAMLATSAGVLGGSLHIVMHAFGKITLFFCAGALLVAAHKTEVSELSGIGRRMPWTMGAFAIASLSMIGLPPTGGFVSKWFILDAAIDAESVLTLVVLGASTVLNAAYLMPIVYDAFFRAPPDGETHGEAPWPMVAAMTLTATTTVLLFFLPDLPLDLANQIMGADR